MAGVSGMSALQVQPFGGLAPFDFDPGAVVWSDDMAKRATAVFAAAPIVQGHYDGSGVPDVLSFVRGNQVDGSFYDNFDGNQGSAVKWWIPEKDRDAGQTNDEYLWYVSSDYWLRYEHDAQVLRFSAGGQESTRAHTSAAGTTYCVVVRWDCNNDLDGGGNYLCISVNNAHTFGAAVQPTASAPGATMYLGSNAGTTLPANAILEGVTWFRRVLYDNPDGIDVGNGDELLAIYAAGAGLDPSRAVNGSWDTTFCTPTNSTAGALVTGNGNAWSHPHNSNLLGTDEGFMFNVAAWNNWVMVGTPINPAVLAAAEKIFPGGYKFDTDAANEGYSRAYACAPNDEFIVRAITHCSAGTVRVELWDATAGASIGYVDGVSNSRTAPNIHLFTGEAPAGCNSVLVRIYNLNNGPTTYCHQAELLENLILNPSLEGVWAGGPPTMPPRWTNAGFGVGELVEDNVTFHSGNAAARIVAPIAQDEMRPQGSIGLPVGDFLAVGCWARETAGNISVLEPRDYWVRHTGTGNSLDIAGAAWAHHSRVFRITNVSAFLWLRAEIAATGWFDDIYALALDAVSLTATAANEANSTEAAGLRIDGWDNAPQPIPAGAIFATMGWMRIGITHRHDVADMRSFGELTPYFFIAWGDATNFILVQVSAANTVTLTFNDGGGVHTANWAAAGLLAAADLDTFEVQWDPAHMELRVDTVVRINIIQPPNFATVPTQWYPGTDQTGAQHVDAVFGPPA